MNYQSLSSYLFEQIATIGEAPVSFALAVALIGLVVWRATRWHYGRTIARLRKGIAQRDGQILAMQHGGPSAQPAAQGGVEADSGHASADAKARRKAVRAVTTAIDVARLAEQSGEAALAMPNVWLALLTARRTFGLVIPAFEGDPAANLDTGRRLLELLQPALRIGDDEAARAVAAEFLQHSGLPEAEPDRFAAHSS